MPDMETPLVHINPPSGVKDAPTLAVYCGESKMTPRERGDNHQDDYAKNLASSHMFKHFMDKHKQEERPSFKMVTVKFFRSAFIRQLAEAVRLRRRTQQPNTIIMNSRGEYSRCRLPRLIIESDPDNVPESVREDIENRVTTTEDEPKAKSDDHSNSNTDLPRTFKKRKVEIDRRSADNKITNHFKPVT